MLQNVFTFRVVTREIVRLFLFTGVVAIAMTVILKSRGWIGRSSVSVGNLIEEDRQVSDKQRR